MNVKEILLADLKPYEKNPRKNDNAVDAVAKSIELFGFKVPIVIDADNVIVCGHTRYKAAQKLGIESVPCVIADDLTPEQIKAFRLADNKTAELASWDFAMLYESLANISLFDMNEFGFDLGDIEGVDVPLDDFDENFSLPNGKNSERTAFQMTFIFAKEQKALIEKALAEVVDDVQETFGNTNKNGNALYEVVRQWAEQKKLS